MSFVNNAANVRSSLETASIEELAASIKAVGVLQPIRVRAHGDREDTIVRKSVDPGMMRNGPPQAVDHLPALRLIGDVEDHRPDLDPRLAGGVAHDPCLGRRAHRADRVEAFAGDFDDGGQPDPRVGAGRQDRAGLHASVMSQRAARDRRQARREATQPFGVQASEAKEAPRSAARAA